MGRGARIPGALRGPRALLRVAARSSGTRASPFSRRLRDGAPRPAPAAAAPADACPDPTQEAPFFRGWGGSWDTPYGRFFLGWYSRALLDHGERLVGLATSVFMAAAPARCTLSNHAAPERSIAGAGPAYGIPGLLPAGGAEPDPAASAGPSSPTGSDRSSGGGAPERARGGAAEAAARGGAGEGAGEGARGGEGPAGFAAAGPGSRAVSRSPSGLSAMSTSTSASTLDAGSEVCTATCAHVTAPPWSCLGT